MYCAFAEDEGWVYVKIGMSVRPFQRVKTLTTGCPFEIKRFVFCHIGNMHVARSFEALAKGALMDHRTRGEWYRFKPEMGAEFQRIIRAVYRKALGFDRPLKWTEVPYETYHANPMHARA
ncbi:MAG TPA: GIY-YIG nuclease family protein [Rudaea sp.]|nr:GIY-YIG nuclease family protein [Rudaea sp.]